MKKLVLGILAHVDAGKTTLSEGLLYTAGNLSRLGRVDHGDAFLDTDRIERERGITIFSKQAILETPELELTLLDTPGHVDFSAEMERTLSVLDYALLVISGPDGVQSHTETLWRLLARYRIPTFVFVNKMDLPGQGKDAILRQLRARLGEGFADAAEWETPEGQEQLSLCGEGLLERYLETGSLSREDVAQAVRRREIFPCRFGSALRLEGVRELLSDLDAFTLEPQYGPEFAARVFKIARDPKGARLTYLKVTGGSLRVKDSIQGPPEDPWTEKADQLRRYSGEKYRMAERIPAGGICAVTGLSRTRVGMSLGAEPQGELPLLEPVLTYRIFLPPEISSAEALRSLSQLEEEDPQLHILWNERLQEMHVQLMGEVQLEVLARVIRDRFGMEVSFGPGSVVYKETIRDTVEGVGHYEPLRHYAEVHLRLAPGERGSGLVFDSVCSTDELDLNWQRLILTHLEEKQHLGVLTGSPITDLHITLLSGRAHIKHTEGGDFRQATYRAVRQGLRRAESVLLEPYYDLDIWVPQANVGRVLTDLQQMGGSTSAPIPEEDGSRIRGAAPVAALRGYPAQMASFTRGRGRISLRIRGYEECRNAQAVIEAMGYDPDSDVENTADSVFCSHGAGVLVPWDRVEEEMHLPPALHAAREQELPEPIEAPRVKSVSSSYRGTAAEDKELQAIYERTYGAVKRREFIQRRDDVHFDPPTEEKKQQPAKPPAAILPEYLLVDGYNIIFAWEELKALSQESLEAARQSLMDILSNYQGYRKCGVILVFDAYKVQGNPGSVEKYHNISVVYTKEAETADMYIEKVTYDIGKKYRVRVATSDGMEQLIILGHGAQRVPALAFRAEVLQTHTEIRDIVRRYAGKNQKGSTVAQQLDARKKKT